jgi:hypothetical protein
MFGHWSIFISLAFSLVATGESQNSEGVVEVSAARSNRDVEVPTELIHEIETWYLAEFRKANPVGSLDDVEVVGQIKRKLLNMNVRFEPVDGFQSRGPIQFTVPTGGGVVDLGDVPGGFRGRYKTRMNFENRNGKVRVFFIGNARERTLGKEHLGSGCSRWADMTSWYLGGQGRAPLEVFTGDQRHVSVLAGTWIMANIVSSELYLGTLTFTDSRYEQLLCRKRSNL